MPGEMDALIHEKGWRLYFSTTLISQLLQLSD